MNEIKNYFAHETAYIDDGAEIGTGTKIWHFSHVMSGAQIGKSCVLGQNSYVGGKAKIGNRVKIQNNVSVYDSVVLEDDVFCGPSCVFTNVVNPRSFVERKTEYRETRIKEGVSIGANATIVCGVTIGEYAFIGAGAVVTKDVKPYALMVGVPALQKGWVSQSGAVLDENLQCPETGEKYQVVNNQLEKENA
ncbi:acyltransferase [Sunxiuqinia indica]|uniref:acyltransferase n=1 Tax=Sunxiuqinia indica TaxID=2692584 RepID=UPI0013582A82|nr:acyltransferase [Sunxiuqinia indica]